jgi:hypothetical protein
LLELDTPIPIPNAADEIEHPACGMVTVVNQVFGFYTDVDDTTAHVQVFCKKSEDKQQKSRRIGRTPSGQLGNLPS